MKILIEESVLRQALETFTHCYAETDRRIKERAKILVELRTALDAAEKAEPVATVGLQHQTWKGYGGQWTPPGEPHKAVHLLKDLPVGTALFAHPAPAVPEVNCSICTNRGGIYGLSQESNCEHCLWQGHWHKKNLYAAPGEK